MAMVPAIPKLNHYIDKKKKMEAIWLDLKWSGCSDFEWCLKSKPFDNQTGLDSLSNIRVQFSDEALKM